MTNQPEPVWRGAVGTPDGPSAAPTPGAERDITTTAKDVAGSAKDEAAAVAQDAKQQARNLAHEAREQAIIKGTEQRDKAVETLRSLSDELDRMAGNATTSNAGGASAGTTPGRSDGTAQEIVRQASQRTRDFSDYLEQREPGELLDELRRFARERPGLFLGLAAGAGVLAGRLTRSAAAELGDDDGRLRQHHVHASLQRPGRRDTRRHAIDVDRASTAPAGRPLCGAARIGAAMSHTAPGSEAYRDTDVSQTSVGQLVGEVVSDLSTLMRQELDLAKAELRQEAKKGGKAAGMLGGAGLAGWFVLLFASLALMWWLDDAMHTALAALIVTALWAVVGCRAVCHRPQTTERGEPDATTDHRDRQGGRAMGQEPDQLRRDIEQTRRDLGEDLDLLTEKVSPARVVERNLNRAKGGVSSVKDKVMGSAGDASASVTDTAAQAPGGHRAQDRRQSAGRRSDRIRRWLVGVLPDPGVAGRNGKQPPPSRTRHRTSASLSRTPCPRPHGT